MSTTELSVQGMSCGACVKHVTEALNSVEGVVSVDVDLQSARVLVGGQSDIQALIDALTQAGYPAQLGLAAVAPSSAKKGGCCCN